MQRFLFLLIVTTAFMQPVLGFCGVSKSMTFELSVTIPEHVIFNNNLQNTPFSKNPYQLVQTQTVVRNNRSISLTSIVVP